MPGQELKALEHLSREVADEELVAIMNVRIHDELYGRVLFRQRLLMGMLLVCVLGAVAVTSVERTPITHLLSALSIAMCVITWFAASYFGELKKVHEAARRAWVALQHKLIQFNFRVQRMPVEDAEQLHLEFTKLLKARGDISCSEPPLNDPELIERCQIAAEIQTGRRPPPAKYEDLSLYDKYIRACDKRYKNM